MFESPFSTKNLIKIFDYENRKGNNLAKKYFPNLDDLSNQLKTNKVDIKEETDENKKAQLYDERDSLKKEKREKLQTEMEIINQKIQNQEFDVILSEGPVIKGKKTYTIDSNEITYFSVKSVQRDIRKLYKVKQANRYNILCQLRDILNNKIPKKIIKTDISNFYESIDRNHLLQKIKDDRLLCWNSIQIIEKIFDQYGSKSKSDKGLPRGVGISAYLSEIYMRDFDRAVTTDKRVLYYARYVDDIIIILPNDESINIDDFFQYYQNLLINKPTSLAFNINKTDKLNGDSFTFEYLGYMFKFASGKVQLALSRKKISKYKRKIDLTFQSYNNTCNKIVANQLIYNRIKYLTGNTKLLNNKKNIFVGTYFSNSLIDHIETWNALDCYLSYKINSVFGSSTEQTFKNRLLNKKFKNGFENKIYYKFSEKDFEEIVRIWKYET